jgi:hypothetical protein
MMSEPLLHNQIEHHRVQESFMKSVDKWLEARRLGQFDFVYDTVYEVGWQLAWRRDPQ